MLLPFVAMGLVVTSCGDDDDSASDTTAAATIEPGGDASGGITVFAAASLTDAYTEIGDAFMAENPDASVAFNVGSSSDLVAQILEGAPADVYASADQANMTKLTDAGANAGEPQVFATNSLAIVVEAGNPLGIVDLADLEDPDLITVTCDPEVPIGAYSEEVFANAGVTVSVDSFEEDVRAVLNKVVLGEADVGVVYSTDVISAGDTATGVEIPDDLNVTPEYPLATTADAPNPDGAAAFSEFVLSDAGQDVLEEYGFSGP